MNPFDLKGPEFLVFYGAVLGFGIVAAFVLRWLLRSPADAPRTAMLDLSPYEVAYLAGGAAAAIDSALVRLINRNILAIDASERRLKVWSKKLPDSATPLEKVLYRAVENAADKAGAVVGSVRTAATSTAERLRARPERFGLLLSAGRARLVRLLPVVVLGSVALIG